jgi:hypothetical protein
VRYSFVALEKPSEEKKVRFLITGVRRGQVVELRRPTLEAAQRAAKAMRELGFTTVVEEEAET